MPTGQEPATNVGDQHPSATANLRGAATVRFANLADRPAVVAMGARCSRRTLAQRFHAGVHAFPDEFVDKVVAPAPGQVNLVAVLREQHDIVGIGTWCQTRPWAGEVGLVVEDNYQRQQIGTRLLQGLVEAAWATGSTTFEAVVLRDHVEIAIHLAGPAACSLRFQPYGDITEIKATVLPRLRWM